MYILDTNVISELRKGKKAEQSVRMWAQALPAANLYLSLKLEGGERRHTAASGKSDARETTHGAFDFFAY